MSEQIDEEPTEPLGPEHDWIQNSAAELAAATTHEDAVSVLKKHGVDEKTAHEIALHQFGWAGDVVSRESP